MRPDRRARSGDKAPRAGEVYFEFYRLGSAIKVTAVDAATGLEVSIMGPSSAAQSELEAVALRKLQRQLKLKGGSEPPSGLSQA